MSIGSVLLQPQRLERSLLISAQASLGDDFLSLASRVVFDPLGSEKVFAACESAFQGIGPRMLDNAGDGFDRAIGRLRALGQPLLDKLSAFTASPPDVEDSAAFFDFALGMVDGAVAFAEALTAEKLRAIVAELRDILVVELKLGPAFLESLLWQAVDESIAKLESLPLEGDADATRRSLVALLRRIKRSVRGVLTLPALSTDQLATNLLDALRRAGLQLFIDEAKCIADAIRKLRAAGTSVNDVVARFGAGSVGAAQAKKPESGDRYCYYASWLASTEGRPSIGFSSAGDFFGGLGWSILNGLPAFPADEVWVTADGRQVIRRNVFRDDEVLHEGTNVQWYEAPLYAGGKRPGYTFKHKGLNPEFMEAWAGWSNIAVDFLKGIAHFIDLQTEPHDFSSNLFHMFWNLINGSIKMSGQPPPVSLLNNAIGGPQALRWAWNGFPLLMTMLCALEGRHTKADASKFVYYVTLLGEDAVEAITYDAVFHTIRDIFLSLFTLLNYDGATYPPDSGPDERPLNRNHLDVWVSLASLGTSKLLTLMIPRENYKYPFAEDNDAMYAWWFAGGTIAGALAGFLGAGIGSFALAQASDGLLLGKWTGKQAFLGMLMFWPTIYGLMEGDTAGGTYNPTGEDFAGYPDHETSPYRLPYAAGTHEFCGQGNEGMWSHHGSGEQVYAYDFGLDQAENVHAARDGTVVDYFDWVANDINPDDAEKRAAMKRTLTDPYLLIDGQTGFLESADRTEEKIDENNSQSPKANFVMIRHDNPFGTETDEQRAAHDRGPGGGQVVTYAVYLHARLNGVRDVLTAVAPGNDATQIIGLQIRRGQPIMLAGNTGKSTHNHLHFNIQTDGSTSPTATLPIKKSSMKGSDLPFVFREVTHVIGTDGVPQSLNHYLSENVQES
jgi:hypothetical protein